MRKDFCRQGISTNNDISMNHPFLFHKKKISQSERVVAYSYVITGFELVAREDQNEYLKFTENKKISHEYYCQMSRDKEWRLNS